MNKILTLLHLIFGIYLSKAQIMKSFYIEPANTWKLHLIETKEGVHDQIVLPYMRIQPLKRMAPSKILVSSAGINVGYKFKNTDKIQLGIMGDFSAEGFNGTVWSGAQGSTSVYSSDKFSHSSGPEILNISLLYKKNLRFSNVKTSSNKRYSELSVNFGFSYFYKQNNGINEQAYFGVKKNAPDSLIYFISATSYVVPVNFINSFKFNFGLDFTFGRGDMEWFSFTASLIYRYNSSAFSKTNIHITATQGNKSQEFNYYLYGSGNGVYFTLSRRIYPFRNLKLERIIKQQRKLSQEE